MKVLHLMPSVDPAGGGPFEYARVMALALKEMGHETVFVTLNKPDAACVTSLEFPIYPAGPGKPFISAARRFSAAVQEAAKDADVAIIHGLWNLANIAGVKALKQAGVPWVTFTHGMLDPYFREIKPIKHWLKQAVWSLGQGRALSGAYRVLFTCQEESRLARGMFWGHNNFNGRVVAFCASDLAENINSLPKSTALFRSHVPSLGDRQYLLFLSRIHPKKACDNLIKAYASIASDFENIDLVFAGPDQIGWQKNLEELAQECGVFDRVHWAGMTIGHAKVEAFMEASAFVLPSHQENFGIVVAEALSVGVPVLISHKVNIWREIIEDGAGLAYDDTVDDTAKMLRHFLSLSEEKRIEMISAARPCYENRFSIEAAASDLEAVLSEAIQKSCIDPTESAQVKPLV